MTRSVLLIGANGQVGYELQRALLPLGDVTATDRRTLDISDPDALRGYLRAGRWDVVVNAAAYTAVDKAESEPELAARINALAPRILAEEAARAGSLLVHYSTDYVFDGGRPGHAWGEDDPTAPLNVYGRTKLDGEDAIRTIGGAHLIFRTSWVYGRHGGNFLKTMMRLMRERDVLSVVADQAGAPTSSRLIADVTALAVSRTLATPGQGLSGTYHLQCSGVTSWCAYAAVILDALRAREASLRCQEVRPVPSEQYPTPAVRPKNSRLNCTKISDTYGLQMPDWRVSLQLCIEELLPDVVSGARGAE